MAAARVIVVAAAVLAAAAPADASARRCPAPAAAVEASRSGHVRVFRRDVDETRDRDASVTLWTCLRGSGRTRKAYTLTYSFVDNADVGPVVVRGPYAAFVQRFGSHYGDGGLNAVVLDARRPGRPPAFTYLTSFGTGFTDTADVQQLLLGGDGTPVAVVERGVWQQDGSGRVVPVQELRDGTGAVVDSGPPRTILDVAVDAGTIAWRHAGEPRTAPLHDPARQPAPTG